MRRFDKLKNIQKANLLNEVRYLESKGFINEYKILDFKNTIDNDGILQYSFNVDELVYEVSLVQSEGDSRLYTLGFGIEGEDDMAIRTGMNLEHLNTVLYTVDSIVHSAVKSKGIPKIMFEGARDVGDSNIPFIDPLRLKAYLRFLKNKYPNSNFFKDRFGHITVDMKSIYPELFEGKETIFDYFIDLIREISDKNPDDWRFEKAYNFDGDTLEGDCDAIENSKYGSILIGIYSSKRFKEHSVNIEFFDTAETIDKDFNSSKELFSYLENKFLNVESDSPSDEPINTQGNNLSIEEHEAELIKNTFNNFGESGSDLNHITINPDGYMFGHFNMDINKNGVKIKYMFTIRKINKTFYLNIRTKNDFKKHIFNNINELITFINSLK